MDVVPGGEADISEIVLDDDLISFRTDAVGVPHLVKVSYFPNWEATGAEGPFHAGPSLMIVIPTQERVTLQFANGGVENLGWILTILGLAGVGAGWVFYRTRSSRRAVLNPNRPIISKGAVRSS